MAAIEVEGLVKRYGRVQALRGVGFAVEPGEVFGLLGPNGAGKTTTLRILAGLVRPDRGAARLLGRPCGPARSRLPLGYLPGEPRPDGDLSGAALLGLLEGLHPGRGAPQRGALAAALGLTGAETSRRLKTLSHGTRQKVALVAALQHDPEVIVLDEPTTGLDPLVQRAFRDWLLGRAAAGRAVLLSSHVLSEVEALCGRVLLLRGGEPVALETVAALRRRAVRRARVRLRGAPPSDPAAVAGVVRTEARDEDLTLWVQGDAGPLLSWLARAAVEDVVFPEAALEDVFPAYYEATDVRR